MRQEKEEEGGKEDRKGMETDGRKRDNYRK